MSRSQKAFHVLIGGAVVLVSCISTAQAKKPDTTGGGGGNVTYSYEFTDLLGLPGYAYQSRGWFITDRDTSDSTLIFGDSHEYVEGTTNTPRLYPVLWHIDDSGMFPSTDPVNLGLTDFAKDLEPTGINNLGVRVGQTRISNEQNEDGAWIFPGAVQIPGGAWQELPSPTGRNTVPLAINDNGVIVGNYDVVNTPDYRELVGGIWQVHPDGSIDDPISLGNFYPTDINNYGVMAGEYEGYLAIGWFEGGSLQIEQMNSSLRFSGSRVNAINDFPIGDEHLTVVGQSWSNEAGEYDAADSQQGYAWRPFDAMDPTTLLGTLGGRRSDAKDVNNAGDIVGWADTKADGRKAFVFSDGAMKDLNQLVDSGRAVLEWANAINNDGDIVGFLGTPRPNHEQHGFLVRPIDLTPSGAAVPEPSTMLLAATGAAMCWRRRRK